MDIKLINYIGSDLIAVNSVNPPNKQSKWLITTKIIDADVSQSYFPIKEYDQYRLHPEDIYTLSQFAKFRDYAPWKHCVAQFEYIQVDRNVQFYITNNIVRLLEQYHSIKFIT